MQPRRMALARRDKIGNGSALAVINGAMKTVNDPQVKEAIEKINEGKETLGRLSDVICAALDIEKRGFLVRTTARILNAVTPNRFMDLLPAKLLGFMVEDHDVLERLATLQRANINSIQEGLRILLHHGNEAREELKQLLADIDLAKKDNWDAPRLLEYLAEKNSVEIIAEVEDAIKKEFESLSPNDQEIRKTDLLGQLETTATLKQRIVDTLVRKVEMASAQVFAMAQGQYYQYNQVLPLVQSMRDAVQNMAETNKSAIVARDAIAATVTATVETLRHVVDAVKIAEQYAIASPETIKLIEDGDRSLGETLLELKQHRITNRDRFLLQSGALDDVIDAETVPEKDTIPAAIAS